MSVSRTGVATVMPFFAVSTFVVMSVSRPVLAEDAGTEPLSLMPVIVKARHSDEALEDVPFTVNVIEA
ncbi:MAG TPA: hypothetical protein DD979_09945, partial [Gammaproteobacteria bacterium]|nr:hypothetical protein [Gammaproteobacteria bacterium]